MRQILLATATLGLALATAATASTWSGGNGNWNSDSSPGWNGTGVPNSQGAVALFHNIANAKVTQDDVDGVTVGQFIRTGTASGDINFTGPTAANAIGMVFDMDGDGPLHAVVSNATTRRISMSNTGYVLNDDLDIVNAVEGNAANTYCISISGKISGTGKNLTLDNVVNAPGANAIALTGDSTFTGNVIVRRGGVRIQSKGFGDGNNPVYLGQNGCGAATIALYGSSLSLGHSFTLAAAPGGTLCLCSFIDSYTKNNWNHILRGPVAMTSPLVVESPRFAEDAFTGSFDFKGILSGAGSLTKTGPGLVTLQAANTYTGGTMVSNGTLSVTSAGKLGTGDVSVAVGATLSVANAAAFESTANLTLGEENSAFGVIDLESNATVKTLTLGTKLQPKGTYGATGSGAATIDDRHFSGNGVLTVLEGPLLSTVLFLR